MGLALMLIGLILLVLGYFLIGLICLVLGVLLFFAGGPNTYGYNRWR